MSERTITSIAVGRQVTTGDLVLVFEHALPVEQCIEREAEAKQIAEATGARVQVIHLEDPRIVVLRRSDLWKIGLKIVEKRREGGW